VGLQAWGPLQSIEQTNWQRGECFHAQRQPLMGLPCSSEFSHPNSRPPLAYDQPLRRSTAVRHFRSSLRRTRKNPEYADLS
jgi:hypothetical protein